MSLEVKWKTPLYKGVDAQKVYEEIGEKNTTPAEIVEKARDPESELHKCFEWDDKKAAENYRLQQARAIMLNLVFVSHDDKKDVRVFYNLTFEKSEYHPTTLVMRNPDEYKALVSKAKGELKSFREKYKMLNDPELVEIFNLIGQL